MNRIVLLTLVLAGSTPFLAFASPPRSVPPIAASTGTGTKTLWRGVSRGDSLFLRAAIDTLPCTAYDTTPLPIYREYRIENSRGIALWHARISGHSRTERLDNDYEFWWCCRDLAAEATPWRDGLVLRVEAFGDGCEPAGDCASVKYFYLLGADSIAAGNWNNWDDPSWDPAVSDTISTSLPGECSFDYATRAVAVVEGSVLRFEIVLSSEERSGAPILREIVEPGACRERVDGTIELLPSPLAATGDSIRVKAADRIQLRTAVLRLDREEDGRPVPTVFRVGIEVTGRRGFVTSETLRALGF